MTRSPHWTVQIPEEKLLPAGKPEALGRAKAKLSPFADEHVEGQICRCEECAESRIRKLARQCNALRCLAEGAPRVGQVTKNLEEVSRCSRQLAAVLSTLDDYSRDWLMGSQRPSRGQIDMQLLQIQAKTQELPPPSTLSMGDGALVDQLGALSKYAELMAGQFEAWRLLNAPFPINDVGGNTNTVTQWHGTPTEKLVIGAYHIYDDFKPGAARKTEHGSFHSFVVGIHSFATGSENGQSALFEYIKQILGPNGALKPPKIGSDLRREEF